MAFLDWIVVVVFLGGVLAVGVLFSRRASGSMADFFVSGRSLPWWLAGTSILATSFASDTPLHVTKVIRETGLSGAWFYWAGILFGPMIAFMFARLWRRAAIVTDVELIELRYAGPSATALRLFMALFRSLAMAALTLGWVILGMAKVLRVLLELPPTVHLPVLGGVSSDALVVAILMLIALFYTAASGLWGVVTTDLIEFVIALGGAIFLAVVAVDKVGGIAGLKAGLDAAPGIGRSALDFIPSGENRSIPWGTFLVYFFVLGWAHAEPDGGGNKAQRFLACKDEKNSLAAGIWSLAVQNILRSWPWYIAALCSIVLYPDLADAETAYPRMIAELLPVGVKGLMVAAFLAAFLSTVDTHMNLGASYLVNDLYRRFLFPRGSDRHYVMVARLGIVVMAVLASVIALNIGSVLEAFKLKGELTAGLGLVCILRWYWWRINAWSEIAALSSSVLMCLLLHTTGIGVVTVGSLLGIAADGDLFPARLLIIVVVSTGVWLTVTLMTDPVPQQHLVEFYRRVRPSGRLWRPISVLVEPIETDESFGGNLGNWGLTTVFVFSAMLGLGKLLLGFPLAGVGLLLLAVVSGGLLYRRVLGGPGAGLDPRHRQ